MTGVAYVDCETTGLDPYRHEIWEVGLILSDNEAYHWMLPVNLATADPIALDIGRFHDRHPDGNNVTGERSASPSESQFKPALTPRVAFARDFARLTHGRHLVGAVISFDAERLWRFLTNQGVKPSWHYHLIDVEALAVGALHGWWPPDDEGRSGPIALPWDSEAISRAVGVDPDQFDKHTALGDAHWAKAIYEKIVNP